MGVRIVLAEKEAIGLALKRFKKLVEHHRVGWELRVRRHFISATEWRRAKEFRRRFRSRRDTLLAKLAGQQPGLARSEEMERFWQRTGKR